MEEDSILVLLVSFCSMRMYEKKREQNVMIDNTLVQGRLNFVEFLVFTSFMFLPMLFFIMVLTQVH